MVLAMVSCNGKSNNEMKTGDIFPKGKKTEANFTGTAWVEMLVTDADNFGVQVYNVIFEPGCRNYWHSHPGGQLLLVTSGEGWYQEEGHPARALKTGDVVEIKPDIIHWHGAAHDKELVHVGISTQVSKGPAVWYGPVTDAEYGNLEK